MDEHNMFGIPFAPRIWAVSEADLFQTCSNSDRAEALASDTLIHYLKAKCPVTRHSTLADLLLTQHDPLEIGRIFDGLDTPGTALIV